MRTQIYNHLEALCHSKQIVCERRGKKIELTTPCGGTTAVCETVGEAFDVYRTDPAFCNLPLRPVGIKLNVDEPAKPARTEEYLYTFRDHLRIVFSCHAETLDAAAKLFGAFKGDSEAARVEYCFHFTGAVTCFNFTYGVQWLRSE